MRGPFTTGDQSIAPGEPKLVIAGLEASNHTPVTVPVHVLHGD
jgi:hypothetical protein